MTPTLRSTARRRLIAALATTLAGAGLAHAAKGDAWHLQKIVVADHLDPKVKIANHYADGSVGYVMLEIDGTMRGTCPGGTENVDFGWNFPDTAELVEGATFNIDISVSGFANDPCKGVMVPQSTIAVQDANAGADALADQTMKAVDQNRFHAAAPATLLGTDADGHQADYAQGMTLVAGPPAPGRPYAYFAVRMTVFGSARGIDVVYVYSKEPAPLVPPTVGVALPPPG